LFSLGRQTINGNWRLLFQQTCPSLQDGTTVECVYSGTALWYIYQAEERQNRKGRTG
jgi:hypothetical protein